MITIFSSNVDGGVVQFAIQMVTTLTDLHEECICYLPENAKAYIPESIGDRIVGYSKVKTFFSRDERILKIAERVLEDKPEIVWYIDSSLLSSQLCCCLKDRVKQFITIHDPANDHPSYDKSIKNWVKSVLIHAVRKDALKSCYEIILLSPESLRVFNELYPQYSQKTQLFTLGAHLVSENEKKPPELIDFPDEFFLFFGRVDKYKGVGTLISTYSSWKRKKFRLVLAGKGVYTPSEIEDAAKCKDIKIINRYIEDEEQAWLFSHAVCLVLPYIEASQSGIIPIAYKYGVPVIVSNINGLTQYVDQDRTGFVCTENGDYSSAYDSVSAHYKEMSDYCKQYYSETMEWENNIKKLLEECQ
ncbi:MAG: glycosyltransferase family 4 protein [Oscillospiraceae bacterium]|nr:glycosyltransferase family 4 protein [Oscillospiraceae bacterium]